MQHNVLDEFREALSTVRAGWPLSQGGLTAVPLLHLSGDVARERSQAAVALEWREATPPNPGRIAARNPHSEPATLRVGELIEGGMSLRAVEATQIIPAQGERMIVVEAVGTRWWDQGALYRAGFVSPLAMSLLFQASLTSGAMAASARTALWSLPDPDRLRASPAIVGDEPYGWLLLDSDRPIAAWLEMSGRGAPAGAKHPHGGSPLQATLAPAIPFLTGYVLDRNAWGRDLVLLPRDLRLVDRVLAGIPTSREPRGPARAGR